MTKVESILRQVAELEQEDKNGLLLSLVHNVADSTVLVEARNLLATFVRAHEMKTGAVDGLSHEATFDAARKFIS